MWQYKLSQGTINTAPKAGYTEIQIFDILLKAPELSRKVLAIIDKAIPYPIFFRLRYQDRINRVAAFKRPGLADENKWVLGDYFETGWQDAAPAKTRLPVALDLKTLYEHMLTPYIGIARREGETLEALVERVQTIRKKQRELKVLKAKMAGVKQFNRKVELNTRIREVQAGFDVLMDE